MLKYRAISFPLLMALLWGIFFAPVNVGMWIFAFCAVTVIGISSYECAKMVDAGLFPCSPKLAGAFSALITALLLASHCIFRCECGKETCSSAVCDFAMVIVVLLLVYLPWLAAVFGGGRKAKKGFTTVAAVLATVIPFGQVAAFYFPDPKYLFFVIMVTKSMDTGGYVFGMLSNKWMPGGNHKLCPSISPKKSWEGVFGGVLLSVLTAWALYKLFPAWDFSAELGKEALWKVLVFGAVLAAASICGDLTESALKRKCGVKDSGALIPGMGGPLDVLDSFIYVGPVCIVFSEIVRRF
ncbi:MAG: phosphatidate cytidylyltransferase [Lentisphaeria bacterium]|nr:phosphatidate cytidylyltransferase [Lentisphaeria bacterium]